MPLSSYVVTGAGRGIGRAIAERLIEDGDHVVALDLDEGALAWTRDHAHANLLEAVGGDVADERVATAAAEEADARAPLTGWVNNAAVFGDGDLRTTPPAEILALVQANLAFAVVGCSVALRHLTAHGRAGAIVNVSSHQAARPVRGALPYATAKAAVEGLTRALAVDTGPAGVRVNAVALGSIRTERLDSLQRDAGSEGAGRIETDLARLHPLGRAGTAREVADVVAFLLSESAAFVSGAVLPVDGGRAVLGLDPEAAG